MALDDDSILRIGRLEDKLKLYEPIIMSMQGLTSVPVAISKIHKDLRTLKDSRIEVRERLTTLFKTQGRVYDDTVKVLEEKAKVLENEIKECPINTIDARLVVAEQDIVVTKLLGGRMNTVEETLESFKLKGWDLLLRILPWIIASCATLWGILKS